MGQEFKGIGDKMMEGGRSTVKRDERNDGGR